jgi:hypothetical protein
MHCQNHADTAATGTCAGCAEPFCSSCLVTVRGATYCAGCKSMAVSGLAPQAVAVCSDAKSALGIAFVGLLFCGPIFGPLALAKASSARKQIAANPALGGKGWADAATVVASIVLLISVLYLVRVFASHR